MIALRSAEERTLAVPAHRQKKEWFTPS